MQYDIITTMIMGSLAMMAWSIMYRETFWYRIAEDLTIGVMGGYVMANITNNTINNYIVPLTQGEIINIIPIIMGILMWTQLSKDYRWLARTPLSFITGIGAAIAMKGAVYGNILAPIGAIATPPTGDAMAYVNHIIAAIATITAVMYFFFTIKPTGVLGGVNRVGRLLMMVGFGSIAGSSVLSNTTFLYNRAQWFINTDYAWVPIAIAVVMVGIDIVRRRSS
jgi:hypothetical protein